MNKIIILILTITKLTLSNVAAEGLKISGEIKHAPLKSVLSLLREVSDKNIYVLGQENHKVSCVLNNSQLGDIFSCISEQLGVSWQMISGIVIFGDPEQIKTLTKQPPIDQNGPFVSVRLRKASLNSVLMVFSKFNHNFKEIAADNDQEISETFINIPAAQLLQLLQLKYNDGHSFKDQS